MSMNAITVSIADRYPVVLYSLRCMLQGIPGFQVVHEGIDPRDIVERIAERPTDLVITDPFSFGDSTTCGFELLRQLRAGAPASRIVLLAGPVDPRRLAHASTLGARSMASKTEPLHEIERACRFAAGRHAGAYLSPAIRAALGESHATLRANLTVREIEIVRLIASGRTLVEIAHMYKRSPSTISTQKQSVLRKLHASSTSDLIRYAYDNGLV